MIELTLPWPPVANTYYRNIGSRTIISAKGRQYSAEIARMLAGSTTLTGRISVRIDAYPPDLRRRDLDGIPKGLLDSLTKAGFWLDDEQIDDLRIVRKDKIKGGKVVIFVDCLGYDG